ncbi:hypothetical protein MJO29_004312 [Puccinia striiformis f. sp. tritici]|nr:hypothetical protein MJO29_004312 [Puccinia striiformis f. sp. tritici]
MLVVVIGMVRSDMVLDSTEKGQLEATNGASEDGLLGGTIRDTAGYENASLEGLGFAGCRLVLAKLAQRSYDGDPTVFFLALETPDVLRFRARPHHFLDWARGDVLDWARRERSGGACPGGWPDIRGTIAGTLRGVSPGFGRSEPVAVRFGGLVKALYVWLCNFGGGGGRIARWITRRMAGRDAVGAPVGAGKEGVTDGTHRADSVEPLGDRSIVHRDVAQVDLRGVPLHPPGQMEVLHFWRYFEGLAALLVNKGLVRVDRVGG